MSVALSHFLIQLTVANLAFLLTSSFSSSWWDIAIIFSSSATEPSYWSLLSIQRTINKRNIPPQQILQIHKYSTLVISYQKVILILFSFYPMMNRIAFSNYQSMNVVHRTKDGHQLWLGDYYAASNLTLLKQKNIRSVLTSAAMLDINYPKQLNINHKTINAFDIPSYKMTPHFEEAFRFIDDALRKGNLLVHCAAGISRSTTFVLVYLMRAENMSFKHAMDYVRSKRPIICPNYGFQNELKRLEINLKKAAKPEKEPIFSNYSQLSQKKVVLDFLASDKKGPTSKQDKLSSTVSGYKPQYNSNSFSGNLGGTDHNGFLRGKSVNYTNKKSIDHSPDIRMTNNFKVGHPKIVTIKK